MRPERARNEGSTGSERLDDTRCTTYRRQMNTGWINHFATPLTGAGGGEAGIRRGDDFLPVTRVASASAPSSETKYQPTLARGAEWMSSWRSQAVTLSSSAALVGSRRRRRRNTTRRRKRGSRPSCFPRSALTSSPSRSVPYTLSPQP